MELVAFSGYARCGKDTAADSLAALGYQRVAFADKLREALVALNPIVDLESGVSVVRVADIVREYGWNGYKETKFGKEVRELLQRLGTEVGRNVLGENVWVNAALDGLDPDGKYVVTDCRFHNEANAVRERGGKVYRITREGVGPANNHASETSLDDYKFDGVFFNDSTLENFVQDIRTFVTS